MLPHQRQPHLGQRRDVPGAHRSELVDDRVHPALQRLAQRGDDRGPQPRTARQQLVRADREHRPYFPGREFVADRAGVAAQQSQAVLGGGLGGHVLVPVGADAGRAPVDAAGRGDLAGRVPGLGRALHRVGAGDRPGVPVGEPDDIGDAEADPVEDDEVGAPGHHRISGAHDPRRHIAPNSPQSGHSILPTGHPLPRINAETLTNYSDTENSA